MARVKSLVRELREAKGIRYKDMIWCISSATIWNAQKDDKILKLSLMSLMKIANLLGCSVCDLYRECSPDEIRETENTLQE